MSERFNPLQYIPRELQVLAGSLTAAAVLAASPALAETPADAGTVPAHLLRQPDELPGTGLGVNERAWRVLTDSSVFLYGLTPASEDPNGISTPVPVCSGEKVHAGAQTFISTAAHCFEGLTGKEYGLLGPADSPTGGGALDFIQNAFYTYAAEDPLQNTAERQPLATVDGISISTRKTDAALLETTPVASAGPQTDAEPGPPFRDFSQFSSLPYSGDIKLVPGQQVAMMGMPQSDGFLPVTETGTYLGRVRDYVDQDGTMVSRKLDIVLTDPAQPYDDACYFGASGSSFDAQEGKKIVMSGPLSMRFNSKYDPYLNSVGSSSGNPKTSLQQSLAYEKQQREYIEAELGVSINPDATLCGYTVLGKTVQADLRNGFGNFAPPLKNGMK